MAQVKNADDVLSGGPSRLADFDFDLGAARPYRANGEDLITVNENGQEKTYRVNDSTLRKDEWEDLDDALVRVARRRLNGISDLRNMGLTRQLGGLGSIISTREKSTIPGSAQQTMDGVNEGEDSNQEFQLDGVPVPITFQDFGFSLRHLNASRNRGDSIDTTSAEEATRNVVEALEDTLFNGSNVQARNYEIYGYTTHPDRVTGANLTASWTNSSSRDIIGDVRSMLQDAYGQNAQGPFMLYVPQEYWGAVQEDYKADSERTFAERIRSFEDIDDIKPSSSLADDNVVLVQMTSDVVQLHTAESMTTVEWETQGGMKLNLRVMAAEVPFVDSDASGQSGIVHYTT
jgi:uncharacterized linocin/CFP29 family protein